MIRTKADLKKYMAQDKRQLGIKHENPRPFMDHIWKYEIELRKYEYWLNQNDTVFTKMMRFIYKFKHYQSGIKLGISIAPNTCEMGLSIAHQGCIQINDNAVCGKNLRIHEGVTIGASGGIDAPCIGDNVFLGSGCKIIGRINISNDVTVGAGAVVVQSVNKPGVTVTGVPAKITSKKNSHKLVFWFNSGEYMSDIENTDVNFATKKGKLRI